MNLLFNAETALIVIGGIVIGWILNFIKSFFTIKKYKKELKDYQDHLERQMKITDAGNKMLMEEMNTLRKDNENLRISVKTLGQKPGRAELRLLNVYDKALRKMMLQAPGFSSAWETSLQEAEAEYEDNETGLKSIVGKVFGSGATNANPNIHKIEHKG
jgi:Fe-S cluster assembly iron-binding protein IscA